MTSIRILIVEDNLTLQKTIAEYLELHGHTLDFASNLALAFRLVNDHYFDVIVLDVMLPDGSGFDFCEHIRTSLSCQTPVLILSARDTLADKLDGFKYGADDYLVKPFSLEELLARINALAARGNRNDVGILKACGLYIDLSKRTVSIEGQFLDLNRIEFTVLSALVGQFPGVVKKSELEAEIWQDEPPGSDPLRSHIYRLRKKIGQHSSKPIIYNTHSVGFYLDCKNEI